MATRACDWRRCELPARLAVLIGDVLEVADRVGVYCLGHGTIKRRAVEQQKGVTVWLDLCGPAQPRRTLMEQPPGQRVLHRHHRPRSGSRS